MHKTATWAARFSVMFIARVAVFLCAPALLVSCADLGTQPYDGLTLRALAQRYRVSDTLHLTVSNNGPSTCQLLSRNQLLSYYIEILDQGVWKVRDTINFGIEPAIYGPIWLKPAQARSNTLSLRDIPATPTGRCRLRTEYMSAGEEVWKKIYSNVFELTN
jgi:hypothetical protein